MLRVSLSKSGGLTTTGQRGHNWVGVTAQCVGGFGFLAGMVGLVFWGVKMVRKVNKSSSWYWKPSHRASGRYPQQINMLGNAEKLCSALSPSDSRIKKDV